jgi:hypothetical protein
VFHVQTEDSGVDNPHIFTHMFYGGVILSSRKLDYDREASEEAVKALMQAQHRATLKDLKKGTFGDKIDSYLGDNPDLVPRPSAAPVEEPAEPTIPEKAPEAVPERSDISGAFDAITGPLPDEGSVGVVHSPAPQSAPAPPGSRTVAGTYSKHRRSRVTEIPAIPAQPAPRKAPAPAPPPPPPPTQARGSRSQSSPVRGAKSKSTPVGAGSKSTQLRGSKSQSSPRRRPKSNSGGVVVSRPAVIVGAPPTVVGGSDPHHQSSGRTRTRKAREDSASDSLFGQDLISEKSLDEVILAYLSEDSTDE